MGFFSIYPPPGIYFLLPTKRLMMMWKTKIYNRKRVNLLTRFCSIQTALFSKQEWSQLDKASEAVVGRKAVFCFCSMVGAWVGHFVCGSLLCGRLLPFIFRNCEYICTIKFIVSLFNFFLGFLGLTVLLSPMYVALCTFYMYCTCTYHIPHPTL